MRQASEEFQGTSYNLLTKNCNHFTSYLCEKLTGRPAPAWVNRAASIGVALPCVVPREWIAPPDYDTADGELLDEDFDERSSMLRHGESHGRYRSASDDDEAPRPHARGAGSSSRSEQGGHKIPAAERAPLPKNLI